MGEQAGYKWFLTRVGVILLGGLVIMAVFALAMVWAQTPTTTTTTGAAAPDSYNIVGSYGNVGYPALTIVPTDKTPSFITNPLKEKRGVILLVYVKNAADDEMMVEYFNRVKAQYASQASFFAFEARDVNELGDVMAQLKINQPPALAVISADGRVYQEYTGWVGEKVMEQVVANALRQ
jgi:hypothetical protein